MENQRLTINEVADLLLWQIKPTRKLPKNSSHKKTDQKQYVVSRINYDIARGRLPVYKKTITKEIATLDIEEVKKLYGI